MEGIINTFRNFEAWIGRSCKPFDKGKLTAFPHFIFCQHNLLKCQRMLKYEELPEINSERWLSLEDLPQEEWRDIEEVKGSYMVSNYGRIKGLERCRNSHYSQIVIKERIRRLAFDKKGYPTISLSINCVNVLKCAVHRLVAKAFISNTENKPQVDHINTIRTDNRVCNLRWVTNRENAYNPLTHKKVHELNSRIGIHHKSAETRKVLSEMKLGKKNPMFGKTGKLSPRSRPVIQLSLSGVFIKEWDNIAQPATIFGNHIGGCCRGERSQCGGYRWVYKSDYLKT